MVVKLSRGTDDISSAAAFEFYAARIEDRLAALLPVNLPEHEALGAAMRDSILAPGKRLRPLMTTMTALDLGGNVDAAIDAGCAVEMVHAASLILDDLPSMDNATMRRGRPATHIAHGEDVAVLAAIATLSHAYRVLAELPSLEAQARLDMVSILTKAVGACGLVAGQFDDLHGGRRLRPVAAIAAANGLKTGSLFMAAVEIGAVVAGAGFPKQMILRDFGGELGHAFQLLDDILDGEPSASSIGKDVGQDEGKSTIVSMLGRASAERRIGQHVASAHRHLDASVGKGSRLHTLTDTIFSTVMPPSTVDSSATMLAEHLEQKVEAQS